MDYVIYRPQRVPHGKEPPFLQWLMRLPKHHQEMICQGIDYLCDIDFRQPLPKSIRSVGRHEGGTVLELKFMEDHFRVYFALHDGLIVILNAGRKATQNDDIDQAIDNFTDYKSYIHRELERMASDPSLYFLVRDAELRRSFTNDLILNRGSRQVGRLNR